MMFLNFIRDSKEKSSDSLSEMGIRDIFQSILSHESSLGIFFYAPSKRNAYLQMAEEYHCNCSDLFPPFHMYVFASATHPLAMHPSVSVKEISKYNYVCYNDSSSLKYLNILGLETNPHILQVSDRGSFVDAIRTGDYISLTSIVEIPSSRDFIMIPISDTGFYINSCYVTAKNYQLTAKEHEFILYLRQQFTKYLQEEL